MCAAARDTCAGLKTIFCSRLETLYSFCGCSRLGLCTAAVADCGLYTAAVAGAVADWELYTAPVADCGLNTAAVAGAVADWELYTAAVADCGLYTAAVAGAVADWELYTACYRNRSQLICDTVHTIISLYYGLGVSE